MTPEQLMHELRLLMIARRLEKMVEQVKKPTKENVPFASTPSCE